jgi:DNA invertase Pin-like site-specific DNA recombinase
LEEEREIIRRHEAGESQRSIAKSKGITKGIVARAINRHKRDAMRSAV